jgi:multicomponent Na+:H+ antiporter subunit F
MTSALTLFAVFLLLNILAGLVRVARGPAPVDRMAAAQLFGTMGVAILLVLAELMDEPALRDAALVFAILGALALVAFVGRVWRRLADREAHTR